VGKMWIFALAAVLAGALAIATVGLTASYPVLPVALIGAIGVFGLFLVKKRDDLLSIGVVLFATLPVAYMAVPTAVGRYMTPTVIVLSVWLIRTRWSDLRPRRIPVLVVAGLFVAALLVVETAVSINLVQSATWSLPVLIGFIAVILVAGARGPADYSRFLRTWAVLTIALAAYGCVEWVAQSNPLANVYYALGDLTRGNAYSVYRIRTTLGHPLANGTFFATSAAVLLGAAVKSRSKLLYVAAGAGALALALTASRGALVGFVLAAVVIVGGLVFSARASFGAKAATVVVSSAAVLVMINSPLIAARQGSSEGSSSLDARGPLNALTLRLLDVTGGLGSGPGTSETLAAMYGYGITIENSLFQAAISLGLPGVLGILLLFGLAFAAAIRNGAYHAMGGIIAYLVSVASFNAWDTNPGIFALAGLVCLLAFSATPAIRTAKTASPKLRRRAMTT